MDISPRAFRRQRRVHCNQFRLDEDPQPYPDPASRFQPRGPHGPSEVIDPTEFEWTDGVWKGVGVKGQVLYEMHIGTFTQEGSWDAAFRELAELADTGITVLEIMPLADFPAALDGAMTGLICLLPCGYTVALRLSAALSIELTRLASE